jgi:hypothetical protein
MVLKLNSSSGALYSNSTPKNLRTTGFFLVVLPLKKWSSRRWVWMGRATQNPEDLMMTKYFS